MVFNSLLEGQCLVYWFHSYTMLSCRPGGLPPENILEPKCVERQKMPLQRTGKMERVQYEGQFLLHVEEDRGDSCLSCLSQHWSP